MNTKQYTFWLAKAAADINEARPDGELIVSSGASPSGTYHIGHLREFLTADAIAWALRRTGRSVRHVHFVDDVDGFRKVPANVPAEFEKHLGTPLYLTPAPDGSNKSYGEYFFDEINQAMDQMGAEMEVIFSHDKYLSGFFTEAIELTLSNLDQVRHIIEETSGRQLPKAWVPIEILDENNKYTDGTYVDFDTKTKTVTYRLDDGTEKQASYTDGHVKLNWRVDWPARWYLLPVAVEPFGRDHATKGGSYENGAALMHKIFKTDPPLPYPYEFINLKGQTKKMSASAGTGIMPLDALKVMPPGMLKHFVLSGRPSQQLFFDVGQGFGRMYDAFSEQNRAFKPDSKSITPMDLANHALEHTYSVSLPFVHLVVAYQAAQKNADKALDILRRSDEAKTVDEEQDQIVQTFDYIDEWLKRWAPEELKFEVQQELPDVELTDEQKELLKNLVERISQADQHSDGEWYHKQIHEAREAHNLEPKQAFQAIYRVILGKDSGPKAGWFLSTFEPSWLSDRFSQAAN